MNDAKRNEDAVMQTDSINPKTNGRAKVNVDVRRNEQTPLSQSRQIITARQMQKIAKGDTPIYLAIVRKTNDAAKVKRNNKRSSAHAAQFVVAHRMTEGNNRLINRRVGPKKNIITVAQREQQALSKVYL